jgi:hypothetical protein
MRKLALILTAVLVHAKKAGTKMDKDLEGMAYQGSDQVFKEKPADSDSSTETFDPEKAKQEAYEDYMR